LMVVSEKTALNLLLEETDDNQANYCTIVVGLLINRNNLEKTRRKN